LTDTVSLHMQYTLFLWPHANARYQAETVKLARAELALMLAKSGVEFEIAEEENHGVPALQLNAAVILSDEVLSSIAGHSLFYLFAERRADGAFLPLISRREACVGRDLPAIQKYSGKTNEVFTDFLLNAALYSSRFDGKEGIRFLDPMCSRGTALFLALNRGWEAVGSDIDKKALAEGEVFFRKYLEYHKFKHEKTAGSLSMPGGKSAPFVRYELARDKDAWKAGERQAYQTANLDAVNVRSAFGRKAFHLMAADLPYGVQHGLRGKEALALLKRALPEWKEALKPGGSVAVSFNSLTLPREDVLRAMEDAGLTAMTGGAYDGMSHWVEQAIVRDVAVGVRE